MCLCLKFEGNLFNVISGNFKNISLYNEQAGHWEYLSTDKIFSTL